MRSVAVGVATTVGLGTAVAVAGGPGDAAGAWKEALSDPQAIASGIATAEISVVRARASVGIPGNCRHRPEQAELAKQGNTAKLETKVPIAIRPETGRHCRIE
jgi:hypothetical protein